MKLNDCHKLELPFQPSDKVVCVKLMPGDAERSTPPLEVAKVYVVRSCLPSEDFSSYGLELVGIDAAECLVPVDRFKKL